jgi:ankyrin repeat protein
MATVVDVTEWIRTNDLAALEAELATNPACAAERTADGISLLQYAAYCRNEAAAVILRTHRPEMDLHEACCWGDASRVARLIQTNPNDVNRSSADGFSPLGLACFFGHDALVDILLTAGADPNAASQNAFKVTPLHSACAISNIDIVKKLLAAGADVNAKQMRGVTPLHSAAHNNRTDIVDLLLAHGADPNAQMDDGKTPFDMYTK